MVNEIRQPSRFYAQWTLPECRLAQQLGPAAHQARALEGLDGWYTKLGRNGGGGILVLPTGGGKTFTAVRFLCTGPLSDGYKVLWLAHTHHLLEQAFHSFSAQTLGSIREPRRELRLLVTAYSDDACGKELTSMTVTSTLTDACVNVPLGAALGSKTAEIVSYQAGTCTPSGGEVIGEPQTEWPVTYCCLPEIAPPP